MELIMNPIQEVGHYWQLRASHSSSSAPPLAANYPIYAKIMLLCIDIYGLQASSVALLDDFYQSYFWSRISLLTILRHHNRSKTTSVIDKKTLSILYIKSARFRNYLLNRCMGATSFFLAYRPQCTVLYAVLILCKNTSVQLREETIYLVFNHFQWDRFHSGQMIVLSLT